MLSVTSSKRSAKFFDAFHIFRLVSIRSNKNQMNVILSAFGKKTLGVLSYARN